MSGGQERIRVPELVRVKRFGVGMMVLLAVLWAAVSVSIISQGDTVYGLLYAGPMLISLSFALAIWRLPTHV